MQRKFILNLTLLLLLNFLIKPFWIFGIDRTVQNLLPAEDYGTYFAIFNFSLLFNILLDVGITSFNNKNIAQHRQLLTKYFSGIIVFKFLLALIYFTVTFVVGYFLGYDSNRFSLLLFLAINQFLISFTQYLRSNITALQLFTLDSILSVLDKSLMILFCAVLLWGNIFSFDFNIMHFVYAQTLAYAATMLVVFGIILFKTKKLKFKLNKPFTLLIIKQTFPYALLVIAMMFYYRLDAIMLDLMLEDGEHQAAIYAQSYRLMDAFIQIPILFAGLLLPMFAFKIKENQSIKELLKLSFEFIFVISISITLLISFYSDEVIALLYKADVDNASRVLQVLIFGFISIAMTNIFGTVLTANGSLKRLNQIAIGGVVLNLSLNLFFIPYLQAYGAAIASIATHFIVVVAQIIIVVKLFKIKTNLYYLASLLLFLVGILAVIIGLNYWVKPLLIKILITLCAALILSMLLRLINPKKLFEIVLKKN